MRLTTTGWALIPCILGSLSPAFPWVDAGIGVKMIGFDTGSGGILITILFAVTLLFLFATSPLLPVPWWRSMTVALLAIGVIIVLLVAGGRYWPGFPTPKHHIGGFVAYMCAFCLLLIVSAEVRNLILRHQASRERGSE